MNTLKDKIDDLLWEKCLGDTAKIRNQILALIKKDKPPIVSWAIEDVSKDVANELIKIQRELDIKHYE